MRELQNRNKLKLRRLTKPNDDENMEQQELSFITDGNANDTAIWQFLKTKHTLYDREMVLLDI